MAHGTDKRQRRRSVTTRLTDPEWDIAQAKADAAGYALGAYTRLTLLGAPGPRSRRRQPADRRELLRLLGEISRVGNNINQTTRALNQISRALTIGQQYTSSNIEQALQNLIAISAIDHTSALQAVDDIRHTLLAALGKDHPGHKDAP